MASGVIPQIMAVFGNCGGGLAVMSSLCDFSFIEKRMQDYSCRHLIPRELQTKKLDTSSAGFNAKSGTVDYVGSDDLDVLSKIRELISIIPSNNEEKAAL